ncbi:MAG: 16S rRNA (cytidine(1402)-2'-O)-methyltransferase [Bacteroidetes bacterium]|nr:16S rRNA (cytidine(1402)-2'-O)-methyltransferase [Bacteroidota bacterium]
MLYIVPSPIGNLGDITYRAVEVLNNVDLILAEDTRTSSILLKHYNINKPLSPYHQHNEHRVSEHLAEQMLAGKSMAVLSDAGTPGISDPAAILIKKCIEQNIKVECLPGATAFVPALINSGLNASSFCFEGFLPLKKGRQTFLKKMASEQRTMIFYESPMRLLKTLSNFIEYFGEWRQCCVSRELSKKFEENFRGSLKEAAEHFGKTTVKGEIVIVVAGNES